MNPVIGYDGRAAAVCQEDDSKRWLQITRSSPEGKALTSHINPWHILFVYGYVFQSHFSVLIVLLTGKVWFT